MKSAMKSRYSRAACGRSASERASVMSALLLKLDDVYWTEDGIVSVQISLAAVAILSALVLALRVLRRGERVVLLEAPHPT